MLRPKVDLDDLAAHYDEAVGRLSASGAHVVLFTIFDPGGSGIYGALRGRMAIFNEWVREISDRHQTTLVDMWRMRDGDHAEVFDTDRMHLNSFGHQYIAFAVLDALGISHDVEPLPRPTLPVLSRARARRGQPDLDPRVPGPVDPPSADRPVLGRQRVAVKRPGLDADLEDGPGRSVGRLAVAWISITISNVSVPLIPTDSAPPVAVPELRRHGDEQRAPAALPDHGRGEAGDEVVGPVRQRLLALAVGLQDDLAAAPDHGLEVHRDLVAGARP